MMKAIISMFAVKFLEELVGVPTLLLFGTVCAIIAFVICLFFNEKLDVEKMHKRNLLVWNRPAK